MAVLGNQTVGGFSWSYYSTNNQASTSTYWQMPTGGTITSVSFYAGGPAVYQGIVWDTGGNILFGSNTISVGAEGWNSASASAHMNLGQLFRIGWWRQNTVGYCNWSTAPSGTSWYLTESGPTAMRGYSSLQGELGAYITYTPDAPPAPTPVLAPTPTSQAINSRNFYLMTKVGLLPG